MDVGGPPAERVPEDLVHKADERVILVGVEVRDRLPFRTAAMLACLAEYFVE